jgi:hypothetical protein
MTVHCAPLIHDRDLRSSNIGIRSEAPIIVPIDDAGLVGSRDKIICRMAVYIQDCVTIPQRIQNKDSRSE